MEAEKIKILLVDDWDDRRRETLRMLEDNNFEVVCANSKNMALCYLSNGNWKPNVVLTFIDMNPEINGFVQVKQPNTRLSKTKLFLVEPSKIDDPIALARRFGV